MLNPWRLISRIEDTKNMEGLVFYVVLDCDDYFYCFVMAKIFQIVLSVQDAD